MSPRTPDGQEQHHRGDPVIGTRYAGDQQKAYADDRTQHDGGHRRGEPKPRDEKSPRHEHEEPDPKSPHRTARSNNNRIPSLGTGSIPDRGPTPCGRERCSLVATPFAGPNLIRSWGRPKASQLALRRRSPRCWSHLRATATSDLT